MATRRAFQQDKLKQIATQARSLFAAGKTVTEAMAMLGVTRSYLYRAMAQCSSTTDDALLS